MVVYKLDPDYETGQVIHWALAQDRVHKWHGFEYVGAEWNVSRHLAEIVQMKQIGLASMIAVADSFSDAQKAVENSIAGIG